MSAHRFRDAARTRKERMDAVLEIIRSNPEGIAVDTLLALSSVNLGLRRETTSQYLKDLADVGLIREENLMVFPVEPGKGGMK
jgi:predicted transcriptional regulator